MRIAVLALQGDFREHRDILERLGAEVIEARLPGDLYNIDGLIIPGGESTTFANLAQSYGLMDPIREIAKRIPVWGTCAGLVFMARDVGTEQPVLGIMDIVVRRNAFGRQVDSFEADLEIVDLEGPPFHGVFIRAPIVTEVGPGVQVLCALPDGRIVSVRQGNLLGSSFHPELTDDTRLHERFLELARSQRPITQPPMGF
jgi:5'-phosphate synthase pdxT subunit